MRPKLAAWLVTGDLPPRLSGAAKNDVLLAPWLRRHGVEPTLVGHPLRGGPRPAAIGGVPVEWLPDPSRGLAKMLYAPAFLRLLARARPRPAIVRFRGFGLRRAACALICRRGFPDVRVAVQPACFGVDDPRSLAASGRGRYQRREMLSADALLAMNPALEEAFRDAGFPAERLGAVRNPVDLERFTPAGAVERRGLRSELGLAAAARVAVTVGGLSRRKGQAWITAALADTLRADPELRLLHVGAGADDLRRLGAPARRVAEARAVAREVGDGAALAALGDRVRLVGLVSDAAPWLRAADVFVQASTREGEANAVNEAMACGLPCVVPDSAVYAWQVPAGTAAIYPAGEGRALAEAVRGVLSSPETGRDMGLAARQQIAATRSPTVVAGDYAALLERMAGPR